MMDSYLLNSKEDLIFLPWIHGFVFPYLLLLSNFGLVILIVFFFFLVSGNE